VANKVLIEVHGSLVILKMLQMVRCGPVWPVRSGAVNSQTEMRRLLRLVAEKTYDGKGMTNYHNGPQLTTTELQRTTTGLN